MPLNATPHLPQRPLGVYRQSHLFKLIEHNNLKRVPWLMAHSQSIQMTLATDYAHTQQLGLIHLCLNQCNLNTTLFFEQLKQACISRLGHPANALPSFTSSNSNFTHHFAQRLITLAPTNTLLLFSDLQSNSVTTIKPALVELVTLLHHHLPIMITSSQPPSYHWKLFSKQLLVIDSFSHEACADQNTLQQHLISHAPIQSSYVPFHNHFLSADAWLNNNLPAATTYARQAVLTISQQDQLHLFILFQGVYAGLLAERRQFAKALRLANLTRKLQKAYGHSPIQVSLYFNLAKIALYRNQPQRALPYLHLALLAAEKSPTVSPLFIKPSDLASFCAIILAHSPNQPYALEQIKQHQLPPPALSALQLHWPWPIYLRVLGQFSVQSQWHEPQPVKKPVTRKLLGLLVMAGPQGLTQEKLVACLWPDSSTSKAQNSLYVALHRIRKNLLCNDDALLSEQGRIWLNAKWVQVDAWQLMALDKIQQTLSKAELQMALSLYQDEAQFQELSEFEVGIWQLRLTSAYERLVLTLGARFELEHTDKALAVYHEGLKRVPLSSGLWEGVLRMEAQKGSLQMLHQSYQLLCKLYKSELDTEPPSDLVQLFKQLVNLHT